MHEFATATKIVEFILAEANRRGAQKILEVKLAIGELTVLSVEQVRFSYGVLTEGTIAAHSKLEIEETRGSVKCLSCGFYGPISKLDDATYHFQFPILICPQSADWFRSNRVPSAS